MEEEHFDEEEMNIEDVAIEAHHKIDALIDLLIKKGIITSEEYDDQIEKLVEEMEEEDDDEECEDCGEECECGHEHAETKTAEPQETPQNSQPEN